MQNTQLSKTTVLDRVYTGHLVVGVSRVQITAPMTPLSTGLILRTPGSSDPTPNTANVWIGGSNVTADSDPITGGFPLGPGAALEINVEDTEDLYFISTAADQEIAWIGV